VRLDVLKLSFAVVRMVPGIRTFLLAKLDIAAEEVNGGRRWRARRVSLQSYRLM
jgi:hypothetical protein